MARIAGIDLPKNKRGIIGLTYIFGVGKKTSAEILTKAGIAFEKRVLTWTDEEIASIRAAIADYKVEGQLRIASSPWIACARSTYTHQFQNEKRSS
jgi:small subunit ribosomal protein S13